LVNEVKVDQLLDLPQRVVLADSRLKLNIVGKEGVIWRWVVTHHRAVSPYPERLLSLAYPLQKGHIIVYINEHLCSRFLPACEEMAVWATGRLDDAMLVNAQLARGGGSATLVFILVGAFDEVDSA